jgi:hypothetical protein
MKTKSAQTGPTATDIPSSPASTTTTIDPRLSSTTIISLTPTAKDTTESTRRRARRQLYTVQGQETLELWGRQPADVNFLFGTRVRLGAELDLFPTVSADGTRMNVTLPAYDELCPDPCQDGRYLLLTIHVPFNNATRADLDCLGTVTTDALAAADSTTTATTYCTSACGPGDFTGCPLDVGGLWLLKNACEGFSTDPATCLNEATSESCAFQAHDTTTTSSADSTPTCTACPPTALCPGGARMWPKRGFWKADEADTSTLPEECPPPSKRRCVGWDGSTLSTRCGTGYAQGTHLCGACAKNWFNTISNRTCQPCAALRQRPQGGDGDVGGRVRAESSEEIGWALLALGCVIVSLTILVFVITSRLGGDRSTGLSRAQAFLFYALVSLQLIAQIGEQATGFEHPIVLRLYWWLSVLSSLDTSESIPTECMNVPYFWSNFTMAGSMMLLGIWLSMMRSNVCRPEDCCGAGRRCCTSERRHCVRTRVTPQFRRYNLSLLILLYSVVARTAIDSVHCVDDGVNGGRLVQASNRRVVCWGNPHHRFNGLLGWLTLIVYCCGLPIFLLWMTRRAPWFDQTARRVEKEERRAKRESKRSREAAAATVGATTAVTTRDGVNPQFLTPGDVERRVAGREAAALELDFDKDEDANDGNLCCRLDNLGTVRARQRSSVLRFVFFRPIVYTSYKPLVECDYHIAYLYFRPLYMAILLVLASLTLVSADAAASGWRVAIGSVALFSYASLLLYVKPMRRTRSWKMPVKVLVILIAWLALILNFVASVVDQSGKHSHHAIQVLSFVVVGLSGMLICVVIPMAAVYELWSGAKKEEKCKRIKKRLLEKRALLLAAAGNDSDRGSNNNTTGGGQDMTASWGDMETLAVDDLKELEELIGMLEAADDNTQRPDGESGADGQHGGAAGDVELVTIGSLSDMTENPFMTVQNSRRRENERLERAAKERRAKAERKAKAERGRKTAVAQDRPDRSSSAPGWESAVDEASGDAFFYNRETRTSVWSVEETWDSNELALPEPEWTGAGEPWEEDATGGVEEEQEQAYDEEEVVYDNAGGVFEGEEEEEAYTYAEEEEPFVEAEEEPFVEAEEGPFVEENGPFDEEEYAAYAAQESHGGEGASPHSELEGIRARILAKMAARMEEHEEDEDAESSGSFQGGGITIHDRRGEWLMVFDDETHSTVYYSQRTGQLRQHRPEGWVRLQASRFGGANR